MKLIFRIRNIVTSKDEWDGSAVCNIFFITFFMYMADMTPDLELTEFIDFVTFSRKMFASQ